jgi:primosomal protein N' (replication factor Y) (superfamily II helicase)
MSPSESRFAEVALPLPLRSTFTYRLPTGFADETLAGARVLVPFGRRTLTGFVVALHPSLGGLDIEDDAVKDVQELIDPAPLIGGEILELTKWAADYYAASWGEMLKAALPAGINAAVERIVSITEKGRDDLAIPGPKRVSITRDVLDRLRESGPVSQRDLEKEFGVAAARRAIASLTRSASVTSFDRTLTAVARPRSRKFVRLVQSVETGELSEPQTRVVAALRAAGGLMLFTELVADAGVSSSVVTTLTKRGVVAVEIREIKRDPLAGAELHGVADLELNTGQQKALSAIGDTIAKNVYRTFLLHGITGSGKTEVYIRAMKKSLEMGRSALMLVPEIALTPIFSRRLRAIFGREIAILHSSLSPGERFDEWRRIKEGGARIVIGTRSAVFAPLDALGLVIVDEEHDASYRQNESPFYNARDTAVMRGSLANAVVILGSATPALETFQNARDGKYSYLHLEHRIGERPLARAELIDMREEFKRAGKDVVISPPLAEAILETHRRGEQSIILLNRRGFSRFVLCRTCGESLRCRNCDITLTFHRNASRLVCHYCGHNAAVPGTCPFCQSEYLYFIGEGTEQLETILQKRFPQLKIARIDRDTVKKRDEMTKRLIAFDRGETDMLVGTQMLAKGHDFHNVTLVGVISVDTGLGLPDFRSAERTFQLLTQVAGRAGRGDLPGRVLIQTYYPEHYALRHAVNQDFDGFFREEMRYRQRLDYPPFTVLAAIMVKHTDFDAAHRFAGILKDALDRQNTAGACRITGPASASIARLKGEFRLQMLVRSHSRKALRELLDKGFADAETAGCDMRTVRLEIDPIDLL